MRFRKISMIILAVLIMIPFFSSAIAAESSVVSVGKSYTLTSESPIDNAYPKLTTNDSGKLTDGKIGGGSYNDSNYLKLYRGTYQICTIDLEKQYTVDKISIGEVQVKGAGVAVSREVYVYASDDGQSFMLVGENVNDSRVVSSPDGRNELTVSIASPCKARYIRVKFSCDVFIYADEISVYGVEGGNGAAVKPEAEKPDVGFAGGIDGVNHIALMYASEYYDGVVSSTGKITYNHLIPYFAYLDAEKNATDSMFEAMLWLPLSPYSSSDSKSTVSHGWGKKTGWELYLDSVFGTKEDINLKALNRLVGDMKTQIGHGEDYQYPVYIGVPYIELSNTPFGDIGNGTITPNTEENRNKIVEWCVDLIISKFTEAGFTNLKLNGMYWYSETVGYSSAGSSEVSVIKHFNEYVESKGYSGIWIPYYCSPGYNKAVELGFTGAVLQTGYAFPHDDATSETGDAKPGVCDDAIKMASKYGLGLEVEVSSLSGDNFKRYYKYLQAAYAAGKMDDGLFMYYQGGGPGVFYSAAYAQASSNERSGYELTYRFIHGTFTSNAPVIEDGQEIIIKLGKKASGQLAVIDSDSPASQLKINETEYCDEVKVSVEGSGFVIVNAKDTAKACECSFSFSVSDGYNISNTATVKVIVVDECFTVDRKNSTLKSNMLGYFDSGETTGTADGTYEVVVENGVVASVGGNNNAIPANGFVLAATGDAQESLKKYFGVGVSVKYNSVTGNVVAGDGKIISDDVSADESSTVSETVSQPNQSENGSVNPVVLIICAVILLAAVVGAVLFIKHLHK